MLRPSFPRWRRVSVRPRRAAPGFAIVATLSLVVVLLVIAIGLLSLSAISMRAGGKDAARLTARTNARMALLLAVGELQKLAGPDTRITATADTLDSSSGGSAATQELRPTGVWRSWEGLDQDGDGRPVAPNYGLKTDAGKPGEAGAKGGRFLGWLVSQPDSTRDPSSPPSLTDGTGKVSLLGSGSVGDSAGANREVHLEPITVRDGAYAWWVGGQNAKANIGRLEPQQSTPVQWKDALASQSTADPGILNISFDDKYTVIPKLASFGTLDAALGSEQARRDHFHSITTFSRGLLTNAATGGWKKDLSLMSEVYPNAVGSPSKTTLLYPWSVPRNDGNDPFAKVGPIASWGALMDYAVQYKQLAVGASNGRVTMAPAFGTILNDSATYNDGFLNKVSRVPVVSSAQLVFAHSALPTNDKTKAGQLDAALTINPVITLWNPWNVEISMQKVSYLLRKSPLRFTYTLAGSKKPPFNLADQKVSLSMTIGAVTLKPGESRVFSPDSSALVIYDPKTTTTMNLKAGYRTRGGYQIRIATPSGAITGKPEDRLEVAMDVNDTVSDPGAAEPYSGAFVDMNYNDKWSVAHRMVFKPEIAKKFYPNLTGLTAVTLGQVSGAQNEVFATSSTSVRCVNDSKFPSRGLLQSNPLTLYSELGLQGRLTPGSGSSISYRGSLHPVNCPFDLSYRGVTGWNDTSLPAASGQDGYILTSTSADKGITHCVMAELPVRPLRSLGELQHFQARGQNPYPPFKSNIIGNSFATPLAASNSALITIGSGNSKMQHDDSYCMNQQLFDAYFFSSIAPEMNDWAKTQKRSMDDVYRDMLTDTTPLPNRAYIGSPLATVPSVPAAVARDLTSNRNSAWKTIASCLEVDGMFNVNSTSVEAWKSLLAHSSKGQVPVVQLASSGWSVSTGGEKDFPLSRTTVAGTGCADGDVNGYDRLGGYRDLTDAEITAMAEGIVKQIHQRGPALSLAEFVNRQLRDGTKADLALSGVIQSALDEMSNSSTTNPYKILQNLCERVTAVSISPQDAEYAFPKAAEGWTGEGLPGWFTQADILRPLAPILSVRDDTFVIRAYGEARDPDGKTLARAWCEATVTRHGSFVQPDKQFDPVADDNITKGQGKDVNITFGRRFEIVSFRYLNPEEV
ncbi:MAG: hypothetical protein JWO82_170 [Akkermansiaceae bacterium]|nr:hypothetical protein [Akkermansiaceae bacterium]